MEEKKLQFFRYWLMFLSVSVNAANTYVLVSFSMPEKLLKATLLDCEKHEIPAVINGLYQDSMPRTLDKIGYFASLAPKLSMLIDPRVFERYQVTQVPALIVEQKACTDIVYGNLSLDLMLEKIKSHGGCHA
ncbi:MAG: conjugal transfer pilus assembly protein TrbC [Pseudomonadota bacterium]|nr:conjugal transfer pilus assembly protein TrbC [Pseudomonadota bacterium]